MRKVLVVMFMTLDGVAEFPRYRAAPEIPATEAEEEDDPMWTPRLGSIDTLFLGRVAYGKWAEFWPGRKSDPKASAWDRAFSTFCDRAEKVVFSKTLPTADWPNTRIVRSGVAEEVRRLQALPGGDMAVGGGPRLAQSFFEHDLVDELLLEVFRSLVGQGKPMFHVVPDPDHAEDFVPLGVPGRRDFALVEAKPLTDGTVFLHYRREGPPATR